MIYVIDASIAVKWFVVEQDHSIALDLLDTSYVRAAPDIFLSEVTNAFRKKIQGHQIGREQAARALDELRVYVPNLVPSTLIVADALDLSLALNHPVADCLYLASARKIEGKVVTADHKFFNKCQDEHSKHVILLTDWMAPIQPTNPVPALNPQIAESLTRLAVRYEETRLKIGRRWFDKQVVTLAAKEIEKAILALSKEQVAYVVAACWLGALNAFEESELALRKAWARHLENARANFAERDEMNLVYITSKLQYLEAGLLKLAELKLIAD